MNPDDLKKQIQKVFLSHQRDAGTCHTPFSCERLLNELLASYPHPDRKELEKIFSSHLVFDPDISTHEVVREKVAIEKEKLFDDLMAWATVEKRGWCIHMELESEATKAWSFCPLCGKPRPE